METLDADGEMFARYATFVVELITAAPREPGLGAA